MVDQVLEELWGAGWKYIGCRWMNTELGPYSLGVKKESRRERWLRQLMGWSNRGNYNLWIFASYSKPVQAKWKVCIQERLEALDLAFNHLPDLAIMINGDYLCGIRRSCSGIANWKDRKKCLPGTEQPHVVYDSQSGTGKSLRLSMITRLRLPSRHLPYKRETKNVFLLL